MTALISLTLAANSSNSATVNSTEWLSTYTPAKLKKKKISAPCQQAGAVPTALLPLYYCLPVALLLLYRNHCPAKKQEAVQLVQ